MPLLHLPADVENFSELPKGYLLAQDAGKTRWIMIIFPNPKVKNGLRAGMIIEPATLASVS
jgi:succinylglutamate desuccinylase